jgi:hypothetical protein
MLLKAKLSCGLVYGFAEHHLDHIAPLCAHLNIPLCVTEPFIKDLALAFYPDLDVHYYQHDLMPSYLLSFDKVVTALPKDLFNAIFFLNHSNHQIESVWCPHGNSDKGQKIFFIEALHKESTALVYGQTMIDFFSQKKALSLDCKILSIGSYRYNFYKKYKAFYKKKLQERFEKLSPYKKTILYAPTWADSEGYSSIQTTLLALLEKRPKNFNLLIKLHPNTLLSDDLKIKKILLQYEDSLHVAFIENFPAIYALLDFIDIYLGDASSIGYDMLHFQKPMLFINIKGPEFDLPLFAAGKVIYLSDIPSIYSCIEKHVVDQPHYKNVQEKLCNKTFEKNSSMLDLTSLLKTSYPFTPLCAPYV